MTITKDTILAEISALDKSTEQADDQQIIKKSKAEIKLLTKNAIKFPLDAFPKPLQEIISTFNNCYQLPIDFFGASLLTAASTLIGNSYKVEYKYKWEYSAILYTAIVGQPGTGKTPAIKTMLGPLFRIEEEFMKAFKEDLETWNQECFEMKNTNTKEPEPPRPAPKEMIINDSTMEAINQVLKNNPRGLLLFKDELAAWIGDMNKYRSAGSDGEAWLSNWSSQIIKINRQGKDPLFIKRPFINVIGGIQPGVLKKIVGDGKAESGFLARILFAFPDLMKKPYDSDLVPDASVYKKYNEIFDRINKLPTKIEPPLTNYETWTVESIILKLSDEGRKLYKKFLKDNTDAVNENDDETIKGIYVKMESYCLRFALILQILKYCSGDYQIKTIEEAEKMVIEKPTIAAAVKLINYFKYTAVKVITRFDSPVNQLPADQRIFYTNLPAKFRTKQAIEIGNKIGFATRTVKRLVKMTEIFKRIGHGEYEKKYED